MRVGDLDLCDGCERIVLGVRACGYLWLCASCRSEWVADDRQASDT